MHMHAHVYAHVCSVTITTLRVAGVFFFLMSSRSSIPVYMSFVPLVSWAVLLYSCRGQAACSGVGSVPLRTPTRRRRVWRLSLPRQAAERGYRPGLGQSRDWAHSPPDRLDEWARRVRPQPAARRRRHLCRGLAGQNIARAPHQAQEHVPQLSSKSATLQCHSMTWRSWIMLTSPPTLQRTPTGAGCATGVR